ncbi:MAG: cold-shock protein [Gammaproteobacteria bacterium]
MNKKEIRNSLIISLLVSIPAAFILFALLELLGLFDVPSANLGSFWHLHAWGILSFFVAAFASSMIVLTLSRRRSRPTYTPGSVAGERKMGNVKWFNLTKGFGFIVQDDGQEVFVHYRSIRGSGRRYLREGQRVEYTVVQQPKGPQAEDVQILN